MYCTNCGNLLDKNGYCKNCNNKIKNNENNINNEKNISLDDKLLFSYIGNNYDKIKMGKFNVWAWFFNILYLLYRKMYLPSLIILFIMNLLSKFSYLFFNILIVVFIILLGFNFNKLYLAHAKKQIRKIKVKNSNLSENNLIEIAGKKGGTSYLGIIIFLIIWFIISTILNFIIPEVKKFDTVGDSSNGYVLKYTVPSEFIRVPIDVDNKSKTYANFSSLNAICLYEIYYNDDPFSYNGLILDTKEGYGITSELDLLAYFKNNHKYNKVTINKSVWYYKNDDTSVDYYSYDKNSEGLYQVSLSGNKRCLQYKDKIAKSLSFVSASENKK